MSNLLGQPFEPWVTKQIDVRQKSLGKYSTAQIQSNLVKTPFIRLASSVDLTFDFESGGKLKNGVPQKLIDSGLDVSNFDGVELAKKSILYGGVVSMTGENNNVAPNSGLNNSSSPFNGAYGWGGIEERGYVPMPGITDVSVQYQNNGALTKTTINIKCFSKRQFQIIDVLYLRPGYSLLLEFGHSTYLNNDGKYDSFENFSSEPLRTLFNPKDKTQYDIYKEIKKSKEEYDGNYEAIYGKITTFKWSFNSDGSYNCQLTLTGMGDVIESLKMNISVEDEIEGEEKNAGEESDDPPLISNKNKSELNKILFNIFQTIEGDKTDFGDITLQNYPNPTKKFKKEELIFKNSLFTVGDVDTVGWGSDNQSPQVYITFGSLLSMIQSKILLHDNSRGVDTSIPLFRFDMDFNDLKNDENYILRIPGGFSADPRICLIPYTNTSPPIPNLELPQFDFNEILSKSSFWNVDGEPYVGRLAGVFVNFYYITKVLDELPLDEENNANLMDFLKDLIKGITQSLGGVNKITITVTEDGLIKFIEEIPQRLKKVEDEIEYARFKTFGVEPGVEGSFLTSLDLNAEIPSSFTATIAIGSQSNGNQKSGNATAFSNYNAGLKDRIIPEKVLSTNDNESTTEDEDKKQEVTIESNFKKIIKIGSSLRSPFGAIYNAKNWFPENIDTLSNLNTTHASLILGRLTQPDSKGEQQLQSPFFLPFNFSLEMEGLSGMKLYQKFKISEEILPPSYEKGGVDIQIKGINHTVNNSGWKTKLDTQSVPAAKLSEIPTSYPLNTSEGGGGSSSTSTGNISPPPPSNPPADEIQRITLRRLADDGEQTYGIMTVFDSSGKVLYALPTVELPWKGNQNSISCIPPNDTYRVKSHSSGKYGKCFWVIGNGKGGFEFDKLFGNGYVRSSVLIHKSPIAPGWLQGCIGPGLKFNKTQDMKDKFGGSNTNPLGTGDFYLNPSKEQSQQAVDKLIGTLYSEGSFLMQIKNLNGVGEGQLPKNLNDPAVQTYVNSSDLYKKLF